jgi:hypothetical protein
MDGFAGDEARQTLRVGMRYRLGCGPCGYVIEDLLVEGHPVVERYEPGLFDLAVYRYEQLEAATPPPPPRSGAAYPPPSVHPFGAPVSQWCPSCGSGTWQPACGRCGRPVGARRDKRTAVALAVLLAFWTWLYTYERDRGKFWVGLAIDVVGISLIWTGVGWMALVGVWIWSIVATASTPASDYW